MAMTADSHSSHDTWLVAQLAADDLAGPERAAAERLVALCDACAGLFADIRAIATATAALPVPARTRDFRLTPADAARLRSPWRRWAGSFAKPRFAFVQPLGAALAMLGLAGLLIGVLPTLGISGSTSGEAPVPPSAARDTAAAPTAAASAAKAAPEFAAPTGTQAPAAGGAAPSAAPEPSTGEPGSSSLRVTTPSAAPSPASGAATAQNPSAPVESGVEPPASASTTIGMAPIVTGPPASAAADAAPAPGGSDGSAAAGAAPASDGAGTQSGPSTVGGAPGGSNGSAAPAAAGSAPASAGIGVPTVVTPGADGQASPENATPSSATTSPLVLVSLALLLVGVALFLVRRVALLATR